MIFLILRKDFLAYIEQDLANINQFKKMKLSNEILNNGLNFSMEFGKNWLIDINDSLLNKYPKLTASELNICNKLCKKVNKLAHDFVIKNPVKTDNEIKFIAFSEFKIFMKTKFNWIEDENLKKLYNQSCYYALK